MRRYILPMRARRTGYIYHGKGTPSASAQRKALIDAGCDPDGIFEDAAPDRENRDAMISWGLEDGDVIVIAKTSVLGSGAKDTADAVRSICNQGALIEVVGCGARAYKTEDDIRNFAALALKTSRRINAKNMLDRRETAGRKLKTADLTPEQWSTVKFLWMYPGVKQQVAVDYVQHVLGFKDVTRVNIAHRIKSEAKQ